MNLDLAFSPLVPFWVIAVLGALALTAILVLALLRVRGAALRALALALLLIALVNPSFTQEEREGLTSVLAIVVDRSASQNVDGREDRTNRALAEVQARAGALDDIETRVIEAARPGSGSDGTELFAALRAGMADVPPDRVAGAIFITDGVVHDVPAKAAELGFLAPLHALVTGLEGERDRRVVLTQSPRFGIVDRSQTIGFRIEETNYPPGGRVAVTVRRDGEEIRRLTATAGRNMRVDVPIAHAGPNVVEIEAEAAPNELTAINNRVALQIQGVREKLRVLLVSGEPHSGERTWRNLLKADAGVDLVHFTILRPPEKQDGTPINELSLIAFPTRELFVTRIDDFDLIIFDRYSRQGILPMLYFDNIAQYVRKGGAVLVAAGPDYAGVGSLSETPLGAVLPAEPRGGVIERPFKPLVTEIGRRHPVTRDLPGDAKTPGGEPDWSRWFRVVEARQHSGNAIISGAGDNPVLLLDRQEEGRVALFLSDHVWLWARGFEGGGPYVDLLRRLAHWLMKEPDLEEEALRMRAVSGALEITRQTMGETAAPVTLTLPSGETRTLTLAETRPGLFSTRLDTGELGLHRASDGTLTALVNIGPANPREFQEVVSTPAHLEPLARETGGSARRIATADGADVDVPRIIAVSANARAYGPDWIGVRQAQANVVRGLAVFPLFAGVLGLLLLIGALAATWAREGR